MLHWWRRLVILVLTACILAGTAPGVRADDCDDDDSDEFTAVLAGFAALAAGTAVTSPWWGPPAAIDDNYEETAHFPSYPYFDSEGGYLRLEEYPDVTTYPWAARVLVDYGTDFNDIHRIGTNWRVDTMHRWGFDGEWVYYDEETAADDSDFFSFGDVNFIWRFAQSGHAMWWTGAGTHWLDRETGTEWGYHMTYGADIFVGKPWVLSGALDWGRTGDEDFFHGRVTFGPQWRHGELFVGFETLNAGTSEADTMLFGFRLWY